MQKIFTKEFKPGEKWSGFIGKGKYIHFCLFTFDTRAYTIEAPLNQTLFNTPDTFLTLVTTGSRASSLLSALSTRYSTAFPVCSNCLSVLIAWTIRNNRATVTTDTQILITIYIKISFMLPKRYTIYILLYDNLAQIKKSPGLLRGIHKEHK